MKSSWDGSKAERGTSAVTVSSSRSHEEHHVMWINSWSAAFPSLGGSGLIASSDRGLLAMLSIQKMKMHDGEMPIETNDGFERAG